jgi:dinuclear metal center YbgI/SA1388 family protein
MKVDDVCRALEAIAPPSLAVEWDNVGLLVGDRNTRVRRIMLCIDLTEAVLAEAVKAKADMVMAYHPVIFKPIARLTAAAEPVVWAAARKGIAVYSMHTALDAAPGGTNDVLAEALNLQGTRPLQPMLQPGRRKVVVFVPPDDLQEVARSAFEAGAGTIGGYDHCAFFGHGIGTFRGGDETRPTLGQAGQDEAFEEMRVEVVADAADIPAVLDAIRATHSYEEPAIDVYPLEEAPADCGLGRVGRLPRPVLAETLIRRAKKTLGVDKVLTARPEGQPPLVSVAAVAAGSCGGMYADAARAGATFYLTGELRHHDALAAVRLGLTVVCVGHSNSERVTLVKLLSRLAGTLPKLKASIAEADEDPFNVV